MARPDDSRPDLCPYCGEAVAAGADSDQGGVEASPSGTPRCRACLAFLDPLSKQVTQGHMGPWFLRDTTRPFYPGVAWEVMVILIARGEVARDTVIRGPGSGQFWAKAERVQGVANLLGCCHACASETIAGDTACRVCGASFAVATERDRLGLPGAAPARRLSAFGTDDELRGGAIMQRPQPAMIAPPPAPLAVSADGELSPLEIALGQEVITERKRMRVLFFIAGGLLLTNVVLATWLLFVRE